MKWSIKLFHTNIHGKADIPDKNRGASGGSIRGGRPGVVFWLLMAICLSAGGLQAENAGGELISRTDTVRVNWTESLVNAVGRGVPPMADLGGDQGRKTALTEAVSDARENLMAAIALIPIDAGSTVGDLTENDTGVATALEEMVAMAEVIHQEFSTDGAVEVIVQMNLNGGFSQLVLPKVIRQIESVKPFSTASPDLSDAGTQDASDADEVVTGPYTGMIIDGRGLGITPCMVPSVYDENGKEIYGPAYASREFAVQYGMSGYVADMDAAVQHPRVAGRPLVLKGLRVGDDGSSDVVVSNTDAARLRSAFQNLALLRQCRVMIVMDDPDAGAGG